MSLTLSSAISRGKILVVAGFTGIELFRRSLIDSTTVEEANEVYITKLALSIGRSKSGSYWDIANYLTFLDSHH